MGVEKVKKIITLVMAINLLAILLIPHSAFALGVAIGPQTLQITDALRGGEYNQSVTVFNPSEAATSYVIRAEGTAAEWLSFYRLSNNEPIEQFDIPGQSNVEIVVRVAIPADASNDNYTATIYAETAPVETGEPGAYAKMQSSARLTISVTGTQKIQGTVGSISVHDTELGIPVRFVVNFNNTGNVAVNPRIDCQISQGGSQVAAFTHDSTVVKPSTQEDIALQWETTGVATGDYTAELMVSLDGNVLDTQKAVFKIMPQGTFTMQGELKDLRYEGEVRKGSLLKLYADFSNTGEADVRARLTVEVYKDSALFDVLESEEILVPLGKTETLMTYFKPLEKASYSLSGTVAYSGKVSEAKVLDLDVTGQGTSAGGGLPWLYIGGGAGGLLVIIVVVFLFTKMR
jgi:uncharacterized membrane protein